MKRCTDCKRLKRVHTTIEVNGQQLGYCEACWKDKRAAFIRDLVRGERNAERIFAAVKMALQLGKPKIDD